MQKQNMFDNELDSLREQLNYHRQAIEEVEDEIAKIKTYNDVAVQALGAVDEAIKQIDTEKSLWLFKEQLMSMFPHSQPTPKDNKVAAYVEKPQLSKPVESNIPATNIENSDRSVDVEQEPVKYDKPYYPNPKVPIKLADYKPGMTPVNKVEITPEIIYTPVDKIAYLAIQAKSRARDYGEYLTGAMTIGSKYLIADRVTIFKDSKYELKIYDINFDDARHLALFKLHRDYNHPDNREARETWNNTKPTAPSPSKDENESLPAAPVIAKDLILRDPPYGRIYLTEVEVGDLITNSAYSRSAYRVTSHQNLFVTAECLFNLSLPDRVGKTFDFTDVFLIEKSNENFIAA